MNTQVTQRHARTRQTWIVAMQQQLQMVTLSAAWRRISDRACASQSSPYMMFCASSIHSHWKLYSHLITASGEQRTCAGHRRHIRSRRSDWSKVPFCMRFSCSWRRSAGLQMHQLLSASCRKYRSGQFAAATSTLVFAMAAHLDCHKPTLPA